MSFQAYTDAVERKTGKVPKEFVAEARKKRLTEFDDIIVWLKNNCGLDLSPARALVYVIQHRPEFEEVTVSKRS